MEIPTLEQATSTPMKYFQWFEIFNPETTYEKLFEITNYFLIISCNDHVINVKWHQVIEFSRT